MCLLLVSKVVHSEEGRAGICCTICPFMCAAMANLPLHVASCCCCMKLGRGGTGGTVQVKLDVGAMSAA